MIRRLDPTTIPIRSSLYTLALELHTQAPAHTGANLMNLSPAAKAALMRASDLGQQRLQRLLTIEEKIVRSPDQYPELWELLQPPTTAEREAA